MLRINGETAEVPASVRLVSELLVHFGLENKIVVVEWNEKILSKSEHAEVRLSEGDRVEIVNFVGGG